MTAPGDGIGGTTIASPTETPRARLMGFVACAAVLLACEALVFRYFFQYGVSTIWASDGASQHFPALLYFHEWVTAVLSGHGSSYGMWSWRLGMGGDVLTTLSYYLADPFALISLLFPVRLLEYVYEGLFFLRVLCAGLAAFWYLRTMKTKRTAAIAGTLVYVFSAFMLQLTVRHPYFANAMILFPLILIGTEWALARRRWYLLAGAVFVAAASNFYLGYQIVLIAAVYAVARWLEVTERGRRLKCVLRDIVRIGGWYVLGALLAAFMLVPLAMAIMASSREAGAFATPLIVGGRVALSYVAALVSARGGSNAFAACFATVGVLAAGVVLLRRGNTALKTMLVAFAVFAAFPVFGRMFNGMTFASYRIVFTAGLFLGWAVAIILSDREPLSRRELAVTGIGLVLFAALDLWACRHLGYPLLLPGAPLGIGALTWALLAAERISADRAPAAVRPGGVRSGIPMGIVLRAGVIVLLVAGIAADGVAFYDHRYNNSLKGFVPIGTALARYAHDPGAQAASLPVRGLQRIDKHLGALGNDAGIAQSNDPLVQGYAGLDFYYSVMADGLNQYTKRLGDRPRRFAYDVEGLDDRVVLDTLAGVRYYLAPASDTAYVPYGFAPYSVLGSETVYENTRPLPVGYVYHSLVTSATYAAMPPLDKQQALLQGIVLADGTAPALPRIRPAAETIEATYTLVPGAGLTWDQASRRVVVKRANAGADLTFAPVAGAELYVEMTGVRFRASKWMRVAVSSEGAPKVHRFLTSGSGYFWGDRTLLVNLGYHATGTTHAHIAFMDRGAVSYGSLKVISVPMARYGARVDALTAEGMRDVVVGADTLSGVVTSHGEGVLFLSIPYSVGWSATVDGVAVPVIEANVGFSGIVLASGTHRVALRYATPGLRTGIVISLLTLVLAIACVVLTERRLSRASARSDADSR